MGYIDRLMGTNERVLYATHQHGIVLFERIIGYLFAFIVFIALAVVLFFFGTAQVVLAGRSTTWAGLVGLIVLVTLVVPVVLVLRAVLRRGEDEGLAKNAWRPGLIGLLILAFGLLVLIKPEWWPLGFVGVALALVPLILLIKGLLDWQNERYLITNRRVMEIKGVVNKLVRDSALEKVNDVVLQQSVVGRLLGYGTVEIITGSDIGVNMFRRIAAPVRFKRAMLDAKEQLHVTAMDQVTYDIPQMPVPASSTPTPPLSFTPAAGGSVADRLAELADLHARGLVTDAEYQAKRQELLNQL